MEKDTKKDSDKKRHVVPFCFIILSISGIVNFLSCCQPLLLLKPEYICHDSQNNEIDCSFETICNSTQISSYQKDSQHSLNNFAYQFDLVCDRLFYAGALGTSYYVGSMIGSILLGNVIDIFGREKPFKILVGLNLLFMICLFFAFSPIVLTVLFFLSGFFSYTKSLCNIIITEFMKTKEIAIIISISNAMFPILGILVGLYFKWFNKIGWKGCVGGLIFISVLTTILSLIYIKETPKWESVKEKENESENSDIEAKKSSKSKSNKNYTTYWGLFKLKSQRKNLIILSFLSFTSSFSYYVLILNMENYSGDFFTNYFITYIAEALSLILSGYVANLLGRLATMKVFSMIVAIAFIIFECFSGLAKVSFIFIFIASFGISAFYNVMSISQNEYFPTVIRGTSVGFLYIISKLATTFVPYLTIYFSHSPLLISLFLIVGFFLMFKLDEAKPIENEETLLSNL